MINMIPIQFIEDCLLLLPEKPYFVIIFNFQSFHYFNWLIPPFDFKILVLDSEFVDPINENGSAASTAVPQLLCCCCKILYFPKLNLLSKISILCQFQSFELFPQLKFGFIGIILFVRNMRIIFQELSEIPFFWAKSW